MLKRGQEHPTEKASLLGVRFAAAMETEEGRYLAESTVKQLTGRDRVSARFMRQDWFDFDPTHSLFLVTNHKPIIRGTDKGIWRRIYLIPFDVVIPEEEQDKGLQRKLKDERAGILVWAIKGCIEYQKRGFDVPKAVRLATDEYRAEMDTLGDFINESCIVHEKAFASAHALYKRYESCCEEAGEHAVSQKKFGMQLSERGFDNFKFKSGPNKDKKGWEGIG